MNISVTTMEDVSTGPALSSFYFVDMCSCGIVNNRQRVILETISYAFLSSFVCMMGIVTNIINIIIFYKQGLDSTMNISFFALAISDLLSVLTLQWTNISINPLMVNSDISFYSAEVQYLVTAWPHVCFGHITCWITAYVTAERCLCIAMPLKIKQIVTPRRTTIIVICMYVINMVSFIPEYTSTYLDWRFFPDRNRSLIALAFTENWELMQGISFIIHAVLGMLSFPAVILFTVVLVIKLRQQAKWRQKTTTDNQQTKNITKRDIMTMKMVVLIAIVLITCYFPGIVASLVTFFFPEFSIVGQEVNLFFSMWGFLFWLEALNSSVNIFLYYKMSTKYRNSFNELFSKCRPRLSTVTKLDDLEG